MFLPTTRDEMRKLGWDRADVILVTGDAYVDTPYSGTAVIGQVLLKHGFRVAILSQPDVSDPEAFRALGEPRLYWGVSAGCVDSMVANYTATGKRRHQDDFTPGGENNRRPDRATIVYSNAIRAAFKPAKPIVLGGIEASLRRIAHYDFWSDKVRRPVICDAKADILSYGMGERSVVELAEALRDGKDWHGIRGICYLTSQPPDATAAGGLVRLPSFAEVSAKTDAGRRAFLRAHNLFAANQDAVTAKTLIQQVDLRWLVHNPPARPLESAELDAVHDIPFMLDAPPAIRAQGAIRALDTIRFSVTTHRGCYGNCRFCAITVHQGRRVVSRSPKSILAEVARFTRHPKFRGTVADVGGPTANMYGFDCPRKQAAGACPDRDCLYPTCCPALKPDHGPQLALLRKIRSLPGVKHVFVASGIRPDLVAADPRNGCEYVSELAKHHVSGQLKLAPEHVVDHVLDAMGKPGVKTLLRFKELFDAASRKCGKRQFLTYYFIAAHPGCDERDMHELRRFATQNLKLSPEQVQIFTPTPLTAATAMYYTGLDPATGRAVYVERGLGGKQRQKDLLTGGSRPQRPSSTYGRSSRR
ncbi:MAG: YgiQ family radical SAM protein [Kiritimatiellia bacterium]